MKIMNENIVTMSLEDYTKLVIENNDLKRLIEGIREKAQSEIEEKIMNSRISNLNTKEEVKNWFDKEGYILLDKFTNGYSYTWERISKDTYGIVKIEEVKTMAVSIVKDCLNERLNEIIEDERYKKENEKEN